jgi:hypothetical protein
MDHQLAHRLARRGCHGREELRLVLGAALHPKDPGGKCFDVYDSTASQVYRPGSAVASTRAAVDWTWSARMTRSGNILQAQYCSTTTACGAWVTGDWMSQNGSRDQTNAGKSYTTILKSYYRGIVVTK